MSSRACARLFVLFFAIFFASQSSSYAFPESEKKPLYLGGGVLSNNVGRYSTADSGEKGLFTKHFIHLSFMGYYYFAESWGISPWFVFTPFGHGSPDEGSKTRIYSFAIRGSKSFTPKLEVHLGPGTYLYQISGAGGTVRLNNGTSTSTFAMPDQSMTSILYYWNLGLSSQHGIIRTDLDAMITDTFSSRRAVNILVTVSAGLF